MVAFLDGLEQYLKDSGLIPVHLKSKLTPNPVPTAGTGLGVNLLLYLNKYTYTPQTCLRRFWTLRRNISNIKFVDNSLSSFANTFLGGFPSTSRVLKYS